MRGRAGAGAARGRLGRHVRGAGLHPAVGSPVGRARVFVEMLVPPLLLLQPGFTTAGMPHEEWSPSPADLW
ncbi:hypothetical protein ABZ079_16975 [Streptomyces sp. NPDC006314]|uniref:hypothetical protein n=1 Tax=Streptomyces sp. NPDC006314 TaxID=3154475 RepID=UPI0033A0E599